MPSGVGRDRSGEETEAIGYNAECRSLTPPAVASPHLHCQHRTPLSPESSMSICRLLDRRKNRFGRSSVSDSLFPTATVVPPGEWVRSARACIAALFRWSVAIVSLTGAVWLAGGEARGEADAARDDDAIRFNRDIRPILSENCFFCHGPDAATREAGLRLDLREEALGQAFVAGDASASELVERIFSDDPELIMPPPASGRGLSEEQKQLLRRWVAAGAEYQSHWSFVAPVRVSPPPVDLAGWDEHPIDRFLYAAMEAEGLTPQAEASREQLLRRLSFDLTGLPPTLEELDAFLADRSPVAYERAVDSLLASPRFGERMTAGWLDVARYSDSYGMQVDRDRRVWPYRDWVVDAFNSAIGYDRFITEQLAGDLLPEATESQILATAFNRLHPQECEGGSVPEEFRSEYVADRTQTVATAFLGLTLECCRCHDHKYDPLTQAEYYQLTGFFDNIDEAGLYSFFTDSCPTPTLKLPTAEQRTRMEALRSEVDAQERRLEQIRVEREPEFERWLARAGQRASGGGRIEPAGQIAHLDFEAETPPRGTTSIEGIVGNAIRIGGDDAVNVGVGNFNRWDPFTVGLWLRVPDHRERAVVFHRSRAWTDAASRGYELLVIDGHLQASLIHFWPGNAVSIRTRDPLTLEAWQHVAVSWDGSSRAAGLAIFVDGRRVETEVVRDALTKNITGGGGDEIAIGARFRDRGLTGGDVDEFYVFDRRLSPPEIAVLAWRPDSPGDATAESADREGLREFYLTRVDDAYRAQLESLRAARAALSTAVDGLPEIMVMREMAEPRPTFLLARGAYDAPLEPVAAATPAALLPWDPDLPDNRLGFAKWLTDPAHPLTARVAVNRLWQTMFGNGLVATPEDFGSQGTPPTHPELLDWLAVEFVSNDWDVKAMIRLMVTSAAYRQASASPDHRDPENRLLSRAPNYRWPAEMLRDNALAISGLLCGDIGGPPAKPYEVESSFKPVSRDAGRGLHRRSLYTYWNRTGPAPALTTLDASLRDVCRMKREVTTTPLQALVILNSPQFGEAARALAERLHHRHGDAAELILRDLFRLTTSRFATPEEAAIVRQLYDQQRKRFAAAPEQAERWLSVGDSGTDTTLDPVSVAAVASVANTLFNYDGCVTKR